MKEELLVELRNEFNDKKQEIKDYNSKVTRVKELKKDAKVKEYLKLTEFDDGLKPIIKSDLAIIDDIYEDYTKRIAPDETNKIYLYFATYMVDEKNLPKRVNSSDKRASYKVYFDIENAHPVMVDIDKTSDFEKDNIILRTYYSSKRNVYALQKEFLLEAVEHGQEVAKERIVKKYTKKKKNS